VVNITRRRKPYIRRGPKITVRSNNEIRAKEIRLIDNENNQLGIVSVSEGLKLAQEAGLDLVEISPTAKPPVCKILDIGKFLYEKQKKEKVAKKKQKKILVKELKLRPLTDVHDINFKVKHAKEFLAEENKVKFTIRFRGREMAHQELGYNKLLEIAEMLSGEGVIESKPSIQGRIMTMIMIPK
jgi:translation initiation factor IF-3